jgi:hypothetical protein
MDPFSFRQYHEVMAWAIYVLLCERQMRRDAESRQP